MISAAHNEPKVCVLTGATSGIGRALAFVLARQKMKLILASRNHDRGAMIVRRIVRHTGNGQVHFIQADLADMAKVRQAAHEIRQSVSRIDLLINNAGARFDRFMLSPDRIELTFATNHLGHFLLTLLLLDHLKLSPASRVINVSSEAHHGYDACYDYLFDPNLYDRKMAYGRSKLANLLFTCELAKRLAGTTVIANAVHPGGVATSLGRNNGLVAWMKHCLYYLAKRQLISASCAAEGIAFVALSKEIQGVSGKYFYNKRQIASSPASCEQKAAEELWDLSVRLCRSEQHGADIPAWPRA